MSQAILEAGKELGRLLFFGALATAIAFASEKLAGLDPNSVVVVVGTLVLRFADKWVHENDSDRNGIAPF